MAAFAGIPAFGDTNRNYVSLARWLRRDREIEMVMIPATRVAGGVAVGAQRVAFDVGGDGELGTAEPHRMARFRFPWNQEPWNLQLQTQKADRFRSAPYSRKTPILATF
jgi:hypothetical protein